MEVVSNNYMPGDPRLVQQLVYELKSQGIFDQFRKECISDVDTKPAYQNLRQRVEGSVTSFLKQQTWRPDMNKNQVREQLRKSIYESGYLETGVERIVDQVVNPKINTVFLPHVEDVVYRYLGIEKPNRLEIKKELKIDVADLLPTDLEAVSPESDHAKEDSFNLNDSLNVDSKLEEDESPPFEPLDVPVQQSDVQQEDNSVDSHLSGFSGLQSHDSNPCNETKICQMELSNQDSQVSHNSSESHLSIVTSEENTKMEVCEESEPKFHQTIDSEEKIEVPNETQPNPDEFIKKDTEEVKKTEKTDLERKDEKTFEEKKSDDKKVTNKRNDDKKSDEKKTEDKKYSDKRNEDKKSRSSEKHSSKDRKDDKYKKSSSSSRDKDKTNSRHSSSTSSKDKDKSKERKESKTSSSNNKEKEKVEKDKEKSEKDRSDKEKSKSEKDRERGDKDKSKSSSSSSKHSNSRDKDKNYSSSKKESSSKDKEKSRSSSSSNSKESKSKSSHSESKSKSSTDKHKKDEKSSHNGKHSNSSSSLKKDKDKKRDSKKESKDDHYSSKEKKNGRRSTDRDSNDGQSGRQNQSNSFTESSSNTQKNSRESSNSNSGNGSGDSGNSDQIEHTKVVSPVKLSKVIENKEVTFADIQKFKYVKPKFASNFEEARKIMKIRKQLAKLERQNQLSLTQIEMPAEMPTINGITYLEENTPEEVEEEDDSNSNKKPPTPEKKEIVSSPKEVTPMLQSTELSKENWEALEARLAQEMSNINYNCYESPYDYDYDYPSYNSIVISPRKNIVTDDKSVVKEANVDKTLDASKPCKLDSEKREEIPSEKSRNILVEASKSSSQDVISKKDPKNDLEKNRKLRVELETSIYKSSKGIVKIIEKGVKITKNGDKHKTGVVGVKQLVEDNKSCKKKGNLRHSDHEIVHKSEETCENVSDTDYECWYLEPPNSSLENKLQFLRRHIKKLECEVEHAVKAIQNNVLPLKRVGCKRKLEENVDFKNNNKAHYEQITDTKKRRRSVVPNPNSVISQANQEKMCNSTDISPNDSFSLPLSPAESDKSNDKKEDESPKLTKQKQNVFGRNTSTRSQRYSSDDLYKPRPIIIASTRRSRSAKNPGN